MVSIYFCVSRLSIKIFFKYIEYHFPSALLLLYKQY